MAATATTAFAAPARAECTESYMSCLREAYAIDSTVLREMKNIECFAGWTGCVGKQVILS